ncbi:PREDICTED: probable G-protein coupled receptor 33 [Gekko japonicus]|uniref:Probable G-protein coupled receptor 33 n=1 Tax=Gekko japonicus TaxID=146911 RepID=A0ABM1LBI9_GEKJA|nr:PREDICTED: probable G-protein coupled receptor 33 [Gekko japonicus]
MQNLMEEANRTVLSGKNDSTAVIRTSHSPVDISPLNLAVAIFVLVSFLVGTLINGLFLWVLGMKMKRTVNTLWFFHLILTYVTSSSYMPFLAVYILLGYRWVFGITMCKAINFFGSLGLFTTVLLLTIISLDRYLLIRHPVWSQCNRTVSRARRVIVGVWLASLTLSAPYLAFRETRVVENGRMVCVNNYALSSDWDDPRMEALRDRIHLTIFLVRFLLAFLIPFCAIMGFYCGMGWEMKRKKLARNRKPIRVLAAAVASFFVCWLPYHLYHASLLFQEAPSSLRLSLRVVFIIIMCFNFWVTPVLYLFVGETFQQVCKTSVLALLKKAFVDVSVVPEDDTSANDEGHPNINQSNL